MRADSASRAVALRGVKLTPEWRSLLADAVNEISNPVASAQGAVVAQIHFTRDRRYGRRTRNTLQKLDTIRSIQQEGSNVVKLSRVKVDGWLRQSSHYPAAAAAA
jgi:hypothetical protein